jgi:hypothetical protein
MRGFAGIVAGIILSILAVPCLLVAGWGLVFNVPTVSVVAFTAAWILLPLFNRFKAIQVLKFAVSFVLIPATLALSPLMIAEVDRQVEALSRKTRHDISAFDLRDRIGIYGLNIVMGVVGYPLYPEASRETLLMMLEPGPSGRRVFHSEFGLGSRKLREKLSDFAASLGSDDTASTRTLGPVRIEWGKSDYRLTEPEARYALALNQTSLTAKAERRGNRWMIDVRHEMEVKYPDSALVTLISRPRLRMEEGLFWVLQNHGWLHPYTTEYRFRIASDDKRLQ